MHRPGSGCFRGTPGYASPEALLNRPLCASSDLYSLGVVLHELLTGTPMNGDGNPNAVMHAMETRQAAPLPEDTPDDLGALILGLTEYQPIKRVFQTATEALTFLEAQGQAVASDAEIERLVAMRSPAREANAGKLPALGWPFEARALPRQGWHRWLPWSLVPVACIVGAVVSGSCTSPYADKD